jgi:hypothetical protein
LLAANPASLWGDPPTSELPPPGSTLQSARNTLDRVRRNPQISKWQGQPNILSPGRGVEVEVRPPSPPQLVTERVRSKIEKLAVPQYYHFRGPTSPGAHLSWSPPLPERCAPGEVSLSATTFGSRLRSEQLGVFSLRSQSWLARFQNLPLPLPPPLERGFLPSPGQRGNTPRSLPQNCMHHTGTTIPCCDRGSNG